VPSAFGTIPKRDVSFVVTALLTVAVMASPNDMPSWLKQGEQIRHIHKGAKTKKKRTSPAHLCECREDATGYTLFMRKSDTRNKE
jgi:hypothetical protein